MKAKEELHLHLYGVLPATKLWELSRERTPQDVRIAWYKDEYKKAFGVPSQFDDFWRSANGIELFTQEYCFKKGGRFAQFQANINLAIALYPLSIHEAPLLDASCHHLAAEGLRFAEFRVFLAPYLSSEERFRYLTMLSSRCANISEYYAGEFVPHLILSLPRDTASCSSLYAEVKHWQQQSPQLVPYFTGIDFCGTEHPHPPLTKVTFMRQVQRDNHRHPPHALAVLYHVGETFEHLHPHNVLRWIWESADLGVHRLGHCSALGYSSALLIGRSFPQSRQETQAYEQWLSKYTDQLQTFGYSQPLRKIPEVYTKDAAADFANLQQAVRKYLTAQKTLIETCPSSNYLISNLPNKTDIPAVSLLQRNDLQVVISSDDPGIFSTSLEQEFALCANNGISAARLAACVQLASTSHAEQLAGRR